MLLIFSHEWRHVIWLRKKTICLDYGLKKKQIGQSQISNFFVLKFPNYSKTFKQQITKKFDGPKS